MRAWLIRWNWMGDHATVADPIVTVMSARTSAEDIRKYVEQRYIEEKASFPEKLAYARYKQPQEPAFPAQLERGGIHCGHNPWLEATKVDDLRVEEDADGTGVLKWDEPPPVEPVDV